MNITIITSNKPRHNYLINLLSKNCKKLFVIQECSTIFTGYKSGTYPKNKFIQDYFNKVNNAEKKIFFEKPISGNNITYMSVQKGDLSLLKLSKIKSFLKSDLFIVFGSSYIKGNLIKFLIKKKAINIHMGISPYYRGTDCNFWALYDCKPELVGATLHLISKGIDNGKIIANATSEYNKNPFLYTMSTVKSAFFCLLSLIKTRKIKKIKPIKQNIKLELRYSKIKDFTPKAIKQYYKKNNKSFKKRKFKLINLYELKAKNYFI